MAEAEIELTQLRAEVAALRSSDESWRKQVEDMHELLADYEKALAACVAAGPTPDEIRRAIEDGRGDTVQAFADARILLIQESTDAKA